MKYNEILIKHEIRNNTMKTLRSVEVIESIITLSSFPNGAQKTQS